MTLSTNCVSIQGRYGIPCVGFGPGAESQAHAPNEVTYKDDLVTAAAMYVAALCLYDPSQADGDATVFRAGLTNNKIDQSHSSILLGRGRAPVSGASC